MNDGDWICTDANCGNINFARRVSCYRCNKERPETSKVSKKKLGTEIGKTAAEKSRGLFNADDWQCNKCANVNWARRQTCNVCNAPKYGEVEARTGYGGGYNERGVVEYRRREESSDDEYDEFGRKKRKRRADSLERERPEKVGITEGAVFKNLPPTVPQKESNKEHNMPGFRPNLLMNTSNANVKRKDSLSDSSMCELPSLTKAAVSRHQKINNPRQDYNMLPTKKTNSPQARKRILSTSNRDQSGSPIYDIKSKKCKRDSMISPIQKLCDPVMENSVSSTKTEMVCKLSRSNPAEDLQVIYNIEERVRCAAFSIVYNNCKIAADKFEGLYTKPAPDFQTIFTWRQRLMSTGCLDDLHLETVKSSQGQPATNTDNTQIQESTKVSRMPNPDEIIITSDSEEEFSKSLEKSGRTYSSETLFIGGNTELQTAGSAASTVDGRGSQARSGSQSTHRRTRSNSRDSQDSNYPDSDSEKGSKSNNSKNDLRSTNVSVRQSLHDSDSESVSYNSGEDDFLSRVFGEDRIKRKVKKTTIVAAGPKPNEYTSNKVNTFEGYSTLKKSEQSPLVTGNIYTNNLRNMNTRTRGNVDIDGCSSEYVPTKIGSTAKKNYQEFKDNVRKKGYWAKGDGSSLTINKHNMSMNVIHQTKGIPNQTLKEPVESVATPQYATVQAKPMKTQADDFTSLDIINLANTEHYLPFDNASENTDRIFAVVQSNNASKNSSILDIFNSGDSRQKSPEKNNDLEKYENIRRMYDNEWDEDDEALYKNTDCDDQPAAAGRAPSPTISNRTQSPTSDMLYITEKNSQPQGTCRNKSIPEFTKNKHDLLLDMLKDLKNKGLSEMVSPLKHGTPQSAEDNDMYQKSIPETIPNIGLTDFEPIPELHKNSPDPIPKLLIRPDPRLEHTRQKPSVARTDRVRTHNMDRHESRPKQTVKKTDTSPKYPMDRHARVPENSVNRSDLISNHNKNRLEPIPNLLIPGTSPIPMQSKNSPKRICNRNMNRSDLTPNPLTRSDSIPKLTTPNQGLTQMISQSELTQNRNLNRPETISNIPMISAEEQSVPHHTMTRSDLNSNLMNIPDPIPMELINEVLRLSEGNVDSGDTQNASKTVSPSKRVRILENITIQPGKPHQNIAPSYQQNTIQHSTPKISQTSNPKLNSSTPILDDQANSTKFVSSSPKLDTQTNNTKFVSSSPKLDIQTNNTKFDSSSHSSSPKIDEKQDTPEKPKEQEQPAPHIDLSDLLSGINTNNLLLALQSLQNMSNSSSAKNDEQITTDQQQQSTEEKTQVAETINLTNDEEWEKESNRDGSIERQLEEMDGSSGDAPFLSDIFDPGPVVIPPNIARKLNLNMPNPEGDGTDSNSNLGENTPVIGNFKSFALPKPILLNRLKVTMKTAEKPVKSSGKRVKRKNKRAPSAAPVPGQPEAEEDDDDESGDEADLSKYDLWGSDAEQGNSSKAENAEKAKDGESAKEGGSDSQGDKNNEVSLNNKSKRRSRSSSTSSTSSSSSSSSHSSTATAPQNKFDDFNLNSERETSPKGRKSRSRSRSRSRSPRSRVPPTRRKSRDSRSAGEARSHESSRDKEYSRERERRDRSRGNREERKERRYSREGGTHYNSRGRHR